jgi:hypothetical protein
MDLVREFACYHSKAVFTERVRRRLTRVSFLPFQSARGLAHSRTLRARGSRSLRASALECGGPPPLLDFPAK